MLKFPLFGIVSLEEGYGLKEEMTSGSYSEVDNAASRYFIEKRLCFQKCMAVKKCLAPIFWQSHILCELAGTC